MSEEIKIETKIRKCNVCHNELPLEAEYFYPSKTKNGFTYTCKICTYITFRLWGRFNKHKIHREKYSNISLERKKRMGVYQTKWQRANRDKTRVYDKKYNDAHPEKRKEWQRKYSKKRYYQKKDTDANYIVSKRLRTRVYLLLKEHRKSQSTMELLGCTMDFFLNYIKSLWQEGMSWDNYGKKGWVLDHVRPCASFDLSNEKERFECFNYTNIIPMWEKDNLKKGSFYNGKLYRKQQLIINT